MKMKLKNLLCLSFCAFLLFSCGLNQNNNSSNNTSSESNNESSSSLVDNTSNTSSVSKEDSSSNSSFEDTSIIVSSENTTSIENSSDKEDSSSVGSNSESITSESNSSEEQSSVCNHENKTITGYKDISCMEYVYALYTCEDCHSLFEEQMDYKGSHVYNQKVEAEKFLFYEEKCTTYKVYFYSCVCGEKGEEQFVVGSLEDINHLNVVENIVNSPTYLQPGFGYYYCNECNTYLDEGHEIPCLEKEEPIVPSVDIIEVKKGTHTEDIELPEGFFMNESYVLNEIGLQELDTIYQVPNDEEGRYFAVHATITVNVVAVNFNLEQFDYSKLEKSQYQNKSLDVDDIFGDKINKVKVEYYDNENNLLDSSPSQIGKYKIKFIVNDPYYNDYLSEKIIETEIVKTDDISNIVEKYKYYDKKEISFPSLDFINEEDISITYSFYSNSFVLPYIPKEVGVYQVNIHIDESEFYHEMDYSFKYQIFIDDLAPSIDSNETQYVYDDEIVFEFYDGAGIAFYYIYDQCNNSYVTFDNTFVFPEYGNYVVYAYDNNGNIAAQQYQYLNQSIEVGEIYPTNNSVVTTSIVYLYAENEVFYYLKDSEGNQLNSLTTEYIDGKNVAVLFVEDGQTYYWGPASICGDFTYSFNVSINQEENFKNPNIDNVEVTTKNVVLEIEAKNKINKFYYSSNPNNFFNNVETNVINGNNLVYGYTYYWYVTDENGNQSDTYTFVYKYQTDMYKDIIKINNYQEVVYSNKPYVVFDCESLIDPYVVLVNYKENQIITLVGNPYKDNNYYAYEYDLLNNQEFYVYFKDNINFIKSKIYKLIIDLEKPICGEIVINEETYLIPLGSDNFSADYYYRINNNEWIKYEQNIEIDKEGVFSIELKALDKAGNQSEQSYFYSQEDYLPTLEVISGTLNEFTNQDVTIKISPDLNALATYLYLGEEEYLISEESEFTFDKDCEINVFIKSKDVEGNSYYSNFNKILIDKTAPIIDGIYFESNGEYVGANQYTNLLCVDYSKIIDRNEVSLYFKIGTEGESYILLQKRTNLCNFFPKDSQDHTLVIMASDSVGNVSYKNYTFLRDTTAPTYESLIIDRKVNQEEKTTAYTLKINGIKDNVCYWDKILLRVWDIKGYTSSADPIINEEIFNTDYKDSVEYDLSSLDDNQLYYMMVYMYDYQGNNEVYSVYYFYKYNIATSINVDGYIFSNNNGKYELINYEGEDTNLVLPDRVNGHTYSIGNNFMYTNTNITSVIISDGVTSIGVSAFYGCTSLAKVVMANSVEKIGCEAFIGCTGLKEVTLSDNIKELEDFAFFNCENIENYNVLDGVKYLASHNNPYLIAHSYLEDGLKDEIVIPDQTKFISARAFTYASFSSVDIGDGVVSMGYGTFFYCSNLTSMTLNNNLKTIPELVFGYCNNLEEIIIPTSVEVIDVDAFSNCSKLKEINIPSNIVSIGNHAFQACSSLEEITFGNTITYLGYNIILGCDNLKVINYDIVKMAKDEYEFGLVPFHMVEEENTEITLNIGPSVEMLPDYIFSFGENITKVNFDVNSKITYIGERAFEFCDKLESIEIPEGVKELGRYALAMEKIKYISLPNSLETISSIGGGDFVEYTLVDGLYYLGNETNPYLVLCKTDNSVYKADINENTKFIQYFALSSDSIKEVYVPSNVKLMLSFPNMSDGIDVSIVFENKENWYVGEQLLDSTRMDDIEYIRDMYFEYFDTPWINKG